eukprot:3935261-Pleurochrysis_carterae.AAC.1
MADAFMLLLIMLLCNEYFLILYACAQGGKYAPAILAQARGELKGGRQDSAVRGRQRVRSRVPKAVLDSVIGTPIIHSFSISDVVAVQICQLLLNAKDAATRRALAPHFGLGALHLLLASLYFKSRVPAPSKDSLRRISNILTRRAVGKGAVGKKAAGLVESFRMVINQRRYNPDFASLTAVQAEQQLLLLWDVVNFDASIFEGSISSFSSTEASATVAGSASA